MKANEFFKSMGLQSVKQFLKNGNIRTKEMVIELQKLVESHELIKHIGGLEKSKFEYECLLKFRNFDYERLKQAIADVESCGGERG